MMRRKISRAIRKTLRHFGYELHRTSAPTSDAFSTQNRLVKVKEPVIFDIGANIGLVTMKYRELYPLASIHCFEPFPESFEKLLGNVKGDSRIYCHKAAVSDKKGKALLNANLSSATNSLLETDERGSSYWGKGLLETTSQMEVMTTTIDNFLVENEISHIDILKIDVQGAELAVFAGARNALKSQKISLIYTELIICPSYDGQHKLHEYLAFLDSLDYEFLDFFNPVRRHNQLLQADLIFLSSSFKKAMGDPQAY